MKTAGNSLLWLALAGYAAWALQTGRITIPDGLGGIVPLPGPQVPEPPPHLVPAAQRLREVIQAGADAGERAVLCGFFCAAADTLERDTQVVTTTGQVRAWLIDADRLVLQGRGVSVPGFGAAKDTVLDAAVGRDRQPVTPEIRSKLVAALRAIAWAAR